jgi:hypothetical protein
MARSWIKEVRMNVIDFAAARALRPPRRTDQENEKASFGKVYEIETARRARSARIPSSVQEEMEAAAALYDELADEDLQIRFSEAGGRVVAKLCDADGGVVRRLSLLDVLALDVDPETAA